MRVLFLQFRDDESRTHERDSVLKLSGLQSSDLKIMQVNRRLPTLSDLDGVQAILLGATGQETIMKEDPVRLDQLAIFLREARNRKISMLGFNYGAHLLTIVFGGSVVHDPSTKEVGICTVMKDEDSKNDPIFKHFPDRFYVLTGHINRIESLPSGAQLLLHSEKCPFEGWGFPTEGIYALEFQVELDTDTLAQRLVAYQETFVSEPGELEHYLLTLQATPESLRVLPLFFSEVVEKRT